MLIALFGALPEPTHSLDQLLVLLHRPAFVAWMICTFFAIAMILLMVFLLPKFTSSSHHRRPSSRSRSLSRSFTGQSMLFGASQHRVTPRMRLIVGMSLGAVSAVLSAHCLLIAKSAVELLVQTATGSNQFNRFESWLILVALVAFALSQLYFLHRGLKLCSTSVLYPFVFCIYNIIAILDGLIYFNQTNRLPPLHAGLIALGTCILLAGVLALSWRLGEERPQEHVDPSYPHAHSPTTAELGQQNLLTPGMGMVEDTATETPSPRSTPGTEADAYHWVDSDDDEHDRPDEGVANARRRPIVDTEHTPLLARKHSASTPSRNYTTPSSTLRRARFRDVENTEEPSPDDATDAWDALMDVGARELAARDSPARSTLRKPRRASTLGLLRPRPGEGTDDDDNNGGPAYPLTPPPLRRIKTVGLPPASERWSWFPRTPLAKRTWLPWARDEVEGRREDSTAERHHADADGDGATSTPTENGSARSGTVTGWFAGLLKTARGDAGKGRAADGSHDEERQR